MKFGTKMGAALLALTTTGLLASEGLRLTAYRDTVGIPTICVGETRGVKMGQTHTREECMVKLERAIVEFDGALGKCIQASVPEETRSAIIQWAYNVGTGSACSSTLVRKLNSGDLVGACNELPRWNKETINGKKVASKGLTLRREREKALCLSGVNKDAP